jgi:Stage II sporulation protein M
MPAGHPCCLTRSLPMRTGMSSNDLVLVQGIRDTRDALDRWRRDPAPVLRAWFAGSAAVSAALLSAVLVVAALSVPDPTPAYIPGLSDPATFEDFVQILGRNSLVLALHALACVAGFIAGSSLKHEARRRTGLARLIHEKAGPVAIAWVVAVTSFSLVTQAYVLGAQGATLAAQFGVSPGTLLLTALPHAVPELVALFLPLAAWLIASRRDEWADLLAATFVTVALAIPLLLVSAALELFLWPDLLNAASPLPLI